MLYLYMEQSMKCYCRSRAACRAKLCWFQSQTCSFWLRSAQEFAGLLRTFLDEFQNAAVDEGCSFYKMLPNLEFSKGLVWWVIMSHLNESLQLTTRCSAASSSVTFVSTDKSSFLIPQHKIRTAVKHFLYFINWSWPVWIRWYKLQPGLSAANSSVKFYRQMRDVVSLH